MLGKSAPSAPPASYYLELALGHDAIYIHAGGSEDAYAKIRQWGVTALDGVNGPYMSNSENGNLMWRDPERRKSYSLEHTVVTTGTSIIERLPTYGLRLEHEEDYRCQMNFVEDGTPAGGAEAPRITKCPRLPTIKPVYLSHDPGTARLYRVEEYGEPYVDGDSGGWSGGRHSAVIVLKTACQSEYSCDSLGHITVDPSSGGTGYFACGGKGSSLTPRGVQGLPWTASSNTMT
ncbi:MAG: DUF3048 domain-containing protein [Flavonifractor plautii]